MTVHLTVCSYHVTYAFQSEYTLKCLSVRLWTTWLWVRVQLQSLKPLQGDSLLSTTMSPGAPDTAWSKLEGWKDESTLQPHNVFELGTTGLEIQHLNHETIASRGTDSKKKHINLHLKREWLVNLNANYPTAFSMLATEPLREERLLLTTEILGVLFFFSKIELYHFYSFIALNCCTRF